MEKLCFARRISPSSMLAQSELLGLCEQEEELGTAKGTQLCDQLTCNWFGKSLNTHLLLLTRPDFSGHLLQ